MGLWGKPDIQLLKDRKDIKRLNKLLRKDDYEIRKEAILAILEIGGMLDPMEIVIDLIRDASPEIRRKAYAFSFAGNLGIMLNIVGIHDRDPELRLGSLKILNFSIKNDSVRELFSRSAIYDPIEQIRKKSRNIIIENARGVDSQAKAEMTSDNANYPMYDWFSVISIYDDLLRYIDTSWPKKENIVYKSKYGVMVPFKSAQMEGCKSAFNRAGNELRNNSFDRAYDYFNAIIKHSVEGLNTFSELVPLKETLMHKKLPYQDYMIASSILIVLIEKFMSYEKT